MNHEHIAVLATGGTIAGLSSGPGYQAACLDINALLAKLPAGQLPLAARQLMALDSCDMTPALMLELARQTAACLQNPLVKGVVITHGTDTIEETAFFLSQLLTARKPVVLTGALRPADALSSDGSMNLQQALLVAACPRAAGVMVVFHDVIWAGKDIYKSFPSRLGAFTSVWGALGQIAADQVHFYRPPGQGRPAFSLSAMQQLPEVALLYGYAGLNPLLVQAAVTSAIKGLVYAAPGNGSIPQILKPVLDDARRQGIVVALASRTNQGWVTAHPDFISSGWLTPWQARIMLMLGLAAGLQYAEIEEVFSAWGGA
jgi:L-asparaginase type II